MKVFGARPVPVVAWYHSSDTRDVITRWTIYTELIESSLAYEAMESLPF